MKRPGTLAAVAAGLAVGLAARPVGAQDPTAGASAAPERQTTWSLQLEAGSEYDSNVHRLDRQEGEDVDVDGSALARLGARHRLAWRRTERERLTLSSHAGLKLFGSDSAQTENVAVLAGDGAYEWSLPSRGAVLGVTGTYYDAIPYRLADPSGQEYEGRHFRVGGGAASLSLVGLAGHRVSAMAGYRAFHYKPSERLDWQGGHAGLLYQGTFWRGDPDEDDDAASVEVSAGYRVEQRDYDWPARTNSCPADQSAVADCIGGTGLERADLNHSLAAEAVYTGRRVYSARYELQVNDSNSFGESLVRQRLQLDVTTELFRELYLTAEATVLVHIYSDPLLIPRDEQALNFISIDEENRNSLSLHLSRALGPTWSLEGRYAIYSNEFTNQELTFRRQTAYLGVIYRTDR